MERKGNITLVEAESFDVLKSGQKPVILEPRPAEIDWTVLAQQVAEQKPDILVKTTAFERLTPPCTDCNGDNPCPDCYADKALDYPQEPDPPQFKESGTTYLNINVPAAGDPNAKQKAEQEKTAINKILLGGSITLAALIILLLIVKKLKSAN